MDIKFWIQALILFTASLLLAMEGCSAQQRIIIGQIEYNNDLVIIHYSLTDSTPGRLYVVRAYFSQDNFLAPLINISGDLGFEVRPGRDKKIIWNPRKELGGSFNGKVSVELRATVFVPFLKLNGFEKYKSVVRGRNYNILWSGGSAQNILNFELLQNDKVVTSFPNIANVGHHGLKFPAHVRVGENYRLRVSDTKNSDEVVYTGIFSIRRRIPLVFKFAAGAIISTGIFALSSKNTEPDLPGPILPK
ncbi:MAG TPA: hypothetical protein VL728_04120 [Cyclobacteriaceae bacterium]|jgi:hypothetical protein|nr:hypothetical protein [Cyclobacteriaceae bacterium]